MNLAPVTDARVIAARFVPPLFVQVSVPRIFHILGFCAIRAVHYFPLRRPLRPQNSFLFLRHLFVGVFQVQVGYHLGLYYSNQREGNRANHVP